MAVIGQRAGMLAAQQLASQAPEATEWVVVGIRSWLNAWCLALPLACACADWLWAAARLCGGLLAPASAACTAYALT